uniref:Potassium voltage-gated channel subfamily KQT member 1 n=1 Tax=Cryptocotyle lingua TaxID=66766 RepID=A0A7U0TJ16_9TREM|nr:potassium voltage-gated channel subfamily KQT member 1 [Cryptocotyle lingua]
MYPVHGEYVFVDSCLADPRNQSKTQRDNWNCSMQLRSLAAHQSNDCSTNDPWTPVSLEEDNEWNKSLSTVEITDLTSCAMARKKADVLFDCDAAELDVFDGKACDTLSARRTSLHGKTITVRISRNETKYRKLQAQVYNFLERPKSWRSFVYHGCVFASVFGCLVLSVLTTIESYTQVAMQVLLYMELVILFWFFTEYCIRLWSAGCRSRYQTWRGRIQFAKRPFCLVDFVVIVASVVILAVDNNGNMFAASALRGLRFFQILRMIRMDRRGGSFKLLASVVWAHRQELFTTVYIGFLCLIFTSFLIYLAEKNTNEKIQSYADALWWGVVTLCTVGYGDTVPKTPMGKIIAAFCALAGISFFALPAGILGSGFALKVQQHQRQKHLIRRRVPAATLIQCLWRCYAADPNSSSIATWKIHLRPVRKPVGLTNSASVIERGGFSRLGRFSTLKRRPDKSILVPTSLNTPTSDATMLDFDENREHQQHQKDSLVVQSDANAVLPKSAPAEVSSPFRAYFSESPPGRTGLGTSGGSTLARPWFLQEEDENGSDKIQSVTDTNVTELSETRIHRRPVLQREKTSSFRTRLHANIRHQTSNGGTPDAPESAMRLDRSPTLIKRELTEQEKCAVRIIRKMRFLVARRKFREALRPYDVKDVIEQYSAGHLDMLTRVKQLQSRLDQILGRQGGKPEDVYDSHQSLASRIVKIEHKVESIDIKIDRLVSLFRTERPEFPLPTTGHYKRLPAPLDTTTHHVDSDYMAVQLQPLTETTDSVVHSVKIPDSQSNLPPGFHSVPLITRFIVPKEKRSESIDDTPSRIPTSSEIAQGEFAHPMVEETASTISPDRSIIPFVADTIQTSSVVREPSPTMVRSENQPSVRFPIDEPSHSFRSIDSPPNILYTTRSDHTRTPKTSTSHPSKDG